MQEFTFIKNGVKFSFRKPKLNEYDKLIMEYKVENIKENNNNEGYYYNSEFFSHDGSMSLLKVVIEGEEYGSVKLPDDILVEVKAIYDRFVTERNKNIEQVVDELISGERNIEFSIVGYDFPHYQAWVTNLPEDLERLAQKIMGLAIQKVSLDLVWENPCDFLERVSGRWRIGTLEELGENILNPCFDKQVQEYYGFKEGIVISFEMNFMKIMNPFIEEQKKQKAIKQKRKEEKKKERDRIMEPIQEIKTEKKSITDEGGKTTMYIHTVTMKSGSTFVFSDRNIFDFGRTINAMYSVADGKALGGLLVGQGGEYRWMDFDENKWWEDIRPLTEEETQAALAILKYYGWAGCSIRM